MFTLLYLIIPNAKVRFGSALMAGIVAGSFFLFFQWGYVYLQRWMASYNAIYGSFVALPLLLIWLQTSWQIFLFGGELSFAYQNIARFGEERESLLVSYDQRRKILLAVMLLPPVPRPPKQPKRFALRFKSPKRRSPIAAETLSW